MRWNVLSSKTPQSIEDLRQILLANRKITDESTFFNPPHPQDISFEEVNLNEDQVKLAVTRIATAIKNKEKIIIFGDYDADGITATAILWQTLHAAGAQVLPFIPDRQKHGYGLSIAGLETIFDAGKPDLIITVDNGIVAAPAIKFAAQHDVEVLITDHHTRESGLDIGTLSNVVAVVHTTSLCGATVAWMLSRAVAAHFDTNTKLANVVSDALDLTAIGTIADQVPLKDANRSFAYHGLQTLETSTRPGIQALFEIASREQKNISSSEVNYVLAPRINAMGRLSNGLDALRLLCTSSQKKAASLAKILQTTNTERQELTKELLELGEQLVEERFDQLGKKPDIVVISSEEFHEGVVGLVAGRLVEKYHRPAIVISKDGQYGKASARSITSIDIISIIRLVKADLLEAGGHPMAAGFSLEMEKFDLVRSKLEQIVSEEVNAEDLEPSIDVECELSHDLVTMEAIEMIDQCAPFGKDNPRPVFKLSNLKVVDAYQMGRSKDHLKLKVQLKNEQVLDCVGWRMGELLNDLDNDQDSNLSIVAKMEQNTWKNRTNIQFVIQDLLF